MTDILEKAIKKAQDNGYKLPIVGIGRDLVEGYNSEIDPTIIDYIIFSHEFAKSFWGHEFINTDYTCLEAWEYHLQQMVLEKEPLKYLEKFL